MVEIGVVPVINSQMNTLRQNQWSSCSQMIVMHQNEQPIQCQDTIHAPWKVQQPKPPKDKTAKMATTHLDHRSQLGNRGAGEG